MDNQPECIPRSESRSRRVPWRQHANGGIDHMNNIVWRREFDGRDIAFVITWTVERQINEVPVPVVLVTQVAPKRLRVLVCNGHIRTEMHALDGVRPCGDIRQGLTLF